MVDTRGTRAGREWAQAVKARDGMCVWCGHAGSDDNPLQADHIEPVSKRPDLSLDLDNGQTLCRRCNLKKSDKKLVRVNWYNPRYLERIEQ